jgi:HK97 family phage major capsid protein
VNLQDGLSATSMSIWGKPVFISNSVPITQTVGTSTDCSTILLADMSRVVVGQSRAVELMMSVDYAFNTDQVALRVTARYDIGLPQPAAVVKTVGVRA